MEADKGTNIKIGDKINEKLSEIYHLHIINKHL